MSFLLRRSSNPFFISPPEPDVESFGAEITLQVPTQAELRHKLASLSSTCTDSASQDTQEEEGEDEDERGGVRDPREKIRADVQAGKDQCSKNCANRDSST